MPGIPVVLLFGATASGKTEVLEKLWADSGTLPPAVEIISADSMQIYRGMDIGTAKPPPELLRRLPHHLIDIRSPQEPFCAGDFVREADLCCQDIRRRGRIPVLCGGTGFYLRNFLLGLPDTPQPGPETRRRLQERLEREGADALFRELAQVDPARAAQLHPRDVYRVLRALEIYQDSGAVQSAFSLPSAPRSGYRFLTLSLDRPRDDLYRRIEARCAGMFRQGLEEEVSGLIRAGCRAGDPGMRAIGYREFFSVPGAAEKLAAGKPLSAEERALVQEAVVRDSKRYAKRQETYMKALPGVIHINAGENPVERIGRLFAAFTAEGNPPGNDTAEK